MNSSDRPVDPFAKLSQLGADQRLFTSVSPTPDREETQQVEKQKNKETRKVDTKQVGVEASQEVLLEPDFPVAPDWYRKQTFEFTEQELDFLDEVKITLRRRHGLRITKNEVVRTALELLAKDFKANKETSFLVRKFNSKKPR